MFSHLQHIFLHWTRKLQFNLDRKRYKLIKPDIPVGSAVVFYAGGHHSMFKLFWMEGGGLYLKPTKL